MNLRGTHVPFGHLFVLTLLLAPAGCRGPAGPAGPPGPPGRSDAATGPYPTAVAAGPADSCALLSDGTVWCWGADIAHELDGAGTDGGVVSTNSINIMSTPIHIPLSSTATAVAVGGLVDDGIHGGAVAQHAHPYEFACALLSTGSVWCWGSDASQTTVVSHAPTKIALPTVEVRSGKFEGVTSDSATAIAAGENEACALLADGTVWCWQGWHTPTKVENLSAVGAIAVGGSMPVDDSILLAGPDACAVLSTDGSVWCWKGNGAGLKKQSVTGVELPKGSAPGARLSVGYDHSCAVVGPGKGTLEYRTQTGSFKVSGARVDCWGSDAYGESLSQGELFVPGGFLEATAVSAGGVMSCAITPGGELVCWGDDSVGELGDNRGTVASSPLTTWVYDLTNVTDVSLGFAHACALADGGLWCWGNNQYGQLGDGTIFDAFAPVPVTPAWLMESAETGPEGDASVLVADGGPEAASSDATSDVTSDATSDVKSVDAAGGTFCASPAVPRITEFPLSDDTGSSPVGIAPGPDGDLWFALQFTPDFVPPSGTPGSGIGRITVEGAVTEFSVSTVASQPQSVTPGTDGHLWFAEFQAGRIARVTTTGTVAEFSVPTAGAQVNGIAAGPDGNVWFTEQNENRVGHMSTAGTGAVEFTIPTANTRPTGIALGPDQSLWFTEQGGANVGRITADGAISEFPVPTPGGYEQDIAVGSDGNLWFTEYGNAKIGRITVAGTVTEFTTPTANSGPWGIAPGPDGNLWFAEASANQIGRITPAGAISEFTVPTADSNVNGIAPGPDGNLWFTEGSVDRIGRVTVCGPPDTGEDGGVDGSADVDEPRESSVDDAELDGGSLPDAGATFDGNVGRVDAGPPDLDGFPVTDGERPFPDGAVVVLP